MSRAALPRDARFFAKVDTAGSCWQWTGATSAKGYGVFRLGRREGTVLAHRFSYETLIGPIPDGLELDHLCHTNDHTCPGGDTCPHRKCVNPEHLEPVTTGENTHRGLSPWGINSRKATCLQGHDLDTLVLISGRIERRCSPCHQRPAAQPDQRCGENNPRSKLTWAAVTAIREAYASGGCTQKSLAARYGVSPRRIRQVLNHEGWRAP